ncbi:MAG: GYD domain-containing protein [Hyphomicrobiaceae bacterium]
MAHYLLRWKLSIDSAKNFVSKPQDRSRPAHDFIESFGGKLESYALGEYDGVGIAEFPDVVSLTAASMLAASTGAFRGSNRRS